ncbi:DUF7345 domain-containing protein [Natrialbaceae archaeon AArc-T1-2]|uniref:DUF7345 domain-containing protein n=1 Tax=Natrialbaceae archaeon AArc-T1-2 TaxID=3053904 RepID=UPI00255AC9C9|nr:hypothetical protein [Natrialbaceae archaeon AArc-T1-2]WIV67209.1 hypothetical protein QQ977_00340 [Natrialbaceae archaeon AArc-T1-2]
MNVRVGWLVLVLVIAAVVGVAPGVGVTIGQSQVGPMMTGQEDIDPDEVRLDVELDADGSAEWTIEFWVRLDDDESTEAFESLEADVADDPEAHTREFAERIDGTVEAASDATGREMSAEGFDVGTERQSLAREYGVVRYSFHWNGFAAAEDGDLHAGDALEGIYLDDDTRLLIGWSEEYELTSVTPDPDEQRDQAVIWRGGQTDFVSGEPRVVVSQPGTGLGVGTAVGGLAVVGALGALAVWWYRTRVDGEKRDREKDQPDGSTEMAVEPTTSSSSADPSRELLSNEEQVLRLIEERGGRMKQQDVVEELGWTDAKTSKVISGLREEGELESFRLGRENVLSLPEEADEQRS